MSDTRLTQADRKFWGPIPEVVAWVAAQIPAGARILEIGPGKQPFFRATHFVDWASHGILPEGALTRCDLQRDRLPFADKEWDFVYCRHVLEDLYDPFHLCDEISRIAKAGYIEVPSPLVEICRGVDGGSPPWRGYHHHRYFVWNKDGVLQFLSKYPAIEHMDFPQEAKVARILRGDPLAWNASLLWRDAIAYRYFQHGPDYNIIRDYQRAIVAAVNEGLAQAKSLGSLFATASRIGAPQLST